MYRTTIHWITIQCIVVRYSVAPYIVIFKSFFPVQCCYSVQMFCKCSLYSTVHYWVIFDSCEQLSIQCIALLRTYLRIFLVATLPVTVSLCSWEIIRLSPLRFLRSDGHVSDYLLILLQPSTIFTLWRDNADGLLWHELILYDSQYFTHWNFSENSLVLFAPSFFFWGPC